MYKRQGSGHFCINGQWLPVKAGDLVIVRSGDTHDGVADEGVSMRIFYLVFKIQDNARAIAPYSDILSLYESGIGARRICHGHREIVPFFDGLFNEIARRESFYGSFMEAYALQLLLAICRACADSNLNSSGDCTADAKELMVHDIIPFSYIHLRLRDAQPTLFVYVILQAPPIASDVSDIFAHNF